MRTINTLLAAAVGTALLAACSSSSGSSGSQAASAQADSTKIAVTVRNGMNSVVKMGVLYAGHTSPQRLGDVHHRAERTFTIDYNENGFRMTVATISVGRSTSNGVLVPPGSHVVCEIDMQGNAVISSGSQ